MNAQINNLNFAYDLTRMCNYLHLKSFLDVISATSGWRIGFVESNLSVNRFTKSVQEWA